MEVMLSFCVKKSWSNHPLERSHDGGDQGWESITRWSYSLSGLTLYVTRKYSRLPQPSAVKQLSQLLFHDTQLLSQQTWEAHCAKSLDETEVEMKRNAVTMLISAMWSHRDPPTGRLQSKALLHMEHGWMDGGVCSYQTVHESTIWYLL